MSGAQVQQGWHCHGGAGVDHVSERTIWYRS
ncbi:MAG: hypothetical protein K0S46_2544 [Moraxellaceae bacterium]|jgi:hypothetical protein|nr:hypothetical protein [Moraxellaceae bacterium]